MVHLLQPLNLSEASLEVLRRQFVAQAVAECQACRGRVQTPPDCDPGCRFFAVTMTEAEEEATSRAAARTPSVDVPWKPKPAAPYAALVPRRHEIPDREEDAA